MACRTLLRRKTQLALLDQACERHASARIGLRRRNGTTARTRLAALERDGVLVAWTRDCLRETETSGQPVEVRFEHEGEHYVFFALTRGRVGRGPAGQEQALLKLSLPLRLEPARCRQHLRLSLGDLPPIMGTFTHVVDERRQFRGRITNIGDGGLGITARSADVSRLYTGDLFWVEVELPGERTASEFVVRLVHLRPVKNSDKLAMGWAFQPTDDVANYEKYLRRLEALIGKQQQPGGVRRTN